MPMDKDLTWKRLSEIWDDQQVKTLETKNERYAIISDTHMGDGGDADDFHNNQNALLNALTHYLDQGYSLILLGDIEEFWQFDLVDIIKRYEGSVYKAYKSFGDQKINRVFGNHDYEWGGLIDPTRNTPIGNRVADEAIKLRDVDGGVKILLVHGHQGSIDSDKYAWFSRFFVRIYRGIEPVFRWTGLSGHGSATKSQVAKDFERVMYSWAKKNRVLLICGHSHRAIFASKSYGEQLQEKIAELNAYNMRKGIHQTTREGNFQKIEQLQREWEDERDKGRIIEPLEPGDTTVPCYFNSGCGLYSDGITVIEIDEDQIRLVKWSKYSLFGNPRQVFHEGKVSEFIAQIHA